MSIIQQLEDLKEWSQDSTRYERRLAWRGNWRPSTEAGTIPLEFDALSPQEQQYYQNPPFSTHPDFLGAKGGSAQLVQPGPGRQGYGGVTGMHRPAAYINYNAAGQEIPSKVGGSYRRYNIKTKRYEYKAIETRDGVKTRTWKISKPGETKMKFFKRMKEKGSTLISKRAKIQSKETKGTLNYLDNWATKWLDNNLDNYGLKQFDKSVNNMSKAWKSHVKDLDIPKGFLQKLTKDGLPNVTTPGYSTLWGNRKAFTYDGFKALGGGDQPFKQVLRKIFYKNQVDSTPELKEGIKQYFDFINRNKRGLKTRHMKAGFESIPELKNVIYMLSDDTGLSGRSKNQLFNSFDKNLSKSYGDFIDKTTSRKYWDNAKKIENTLGKKTMRELLGTTQGGKAFESIQAAMKAEGELLKEIFDVSSLKGTGLEYSMEHGQGLAAAAKSNNKTLMKTAVTDLVGMTKDMNFVLGRGGFEATRGALIRSIQAGENVPENLKSLNKLASKVYKDYGLTGNMYSIGEDGKLISKTVSQPGSTAYDRFGQWGKQIYKDKRGKEAIKSQFGSLKNFEKKMVAESNKILKSYKEVGIGANCPTKGKAEGGRIGFVNAGGVGDKCMRNAIQKHNKDLQSTDLSVKNAARAKQYEILKSANKMKGMKNLFQMGRKGFQAVTGTVGTTLGGPWGAALEVALEGMFYEHFRRKGYNDKQAQAETFFWKMMDPDRETGVWEGAEELLEDELVGKRDVEGYLKSAQPHGESWFDVGADKYQTQLDARDAEVAVNEKLTSELGYLQNQRRPGTEEQIAAKEQELNDSYDRIDELQITLKQGTPEQEAYARAEEKQKALQDRRSEDWEIKKALLEGSIESAEEYERPETYYKEKEKQHRDEFLEYKGAKQKHGVKLPFSLEEDWRDEEGRKKRPITDPYAYKETDETLSDIAGYLSREQWEEIKKANPDYADIAYEDLSEKDKWNQYKYWVDKFPGTPASRYGWDLMGKVAEAGGVSKMATGGIMNLKKW